MADADDAVVERLDRLERQMEDYRSSGASSSRCGRWRFIRLPTPSRSRSQ